MIFPGAGNAELYTGHLIKQGDIIDLNIHI